MYELHQQEQYFFDDRTLKFLSEYLARYDAPCCLCAPLLGKKLSEMGKQVYILDIDTRFSPYRHFIAYDLYRPTWLGLEFDIIVCDPPFFNVSLSQLFDAIRVLSRYNFAQRVMIGYLSRRASNVESVFSPFNLQQSGIKLTYQTIQPVERNEIQLFTNLTADERDILQQFI